MGGRAQRLGRPVLAVPGRPEDALSVGCNEILRSGGRVFLDGSDLLDALSENAAAGAGSARVARPMAPRRAPATESPQAWTPVPSEIRARSPAEIDRILRFVERASTAPSTDEIVRACGLSAPRLHAYLFQLELAGCLRNELGGRWRRA
jgi:DNA processing protein